MTLYNCDIMQTKRGVPLMKQSRYEQFYHELLEDIKSGVYKNGEKLPAERVLCDMYSISRTTVREALRNLEVEGYVIRKQGSGSYVHIQLVKPNLKKLYTLREAFLDQGISHEVEVLAYQVVLPNATIQETLQLSQSAKVVKLVRLFRAAGVPYTIEYSYLPYDKVTEFTKELVQTQGLYASLESVGSPPTRATETIKATKLSKKESNLLQLSNDTLVLKVERITHSYNDIIEYSVSIIHNDYFLYTTELK